jgi:hypothetical protein
MIRRLVLTAMVSLVLSGCLMDALYGDLPDTVRMEPGIHALAGLNSPYDDFNAVAGPPPLKMDAFIAFASNADSKGQHFTIDTGRLRLMQDPYPGRRQARPPAPKLSAERYGAFSAIPFFSGNVRGPTPLFPPADPGRVYDEPFPPHMTRGYLLTEEPLPWNGTGALPGGGVWVFDSDHEGRRNLYLVDTAGDVRPFFGNRADSDEAYATYDFKRHELYFSSNRSGKYRIYRYRNQGGSLDFAHWLAEPSRVDGIEPVAEFVSSGNTMAPFVHDDHMFMASDRPGTLGGFDLFVSIRSEDGWQPPRNLQEFMPKNVHVNTLGNEFRPSILGLGLKNLYDLRVLMFSSDRPGGKGGYDLYVTALPEQVR